MPRIDRNRRTFDDLVGDKVMGTIRQMRFFDKASDAEIRRELHRRYPNANKQALDRVMGLAADSKKSASNYNRAKEGYKQDRNNMGTNPRLLTAYLWTVNVTLTNPATGEQSHRLVMVDSPRNMTKGEIQAEAEAVARSQFNSKSQKDKYGMPTQDDNAVATFQFVSVECRTC